MKSVTVFKSAAVGKSEVAAFNIQVKARAAAKAKVKETGQRGKTAEKAVKALLERLNEKHFDFAYSRLPDARAAGGRLGAVICDFLVWYRGKSLLLEVKETQQNRRLAKDKLSQLATLQKVKAAGATPVVLVYHTELDRWRVSGVDFFEFGRPSWDLSDLVLYVSAAEALGSTLLFPI